jgi:hypothetical protein
MSLPTPTVFLVTWIDKDGITYSEPMPDRASAHRRVEYLRRRGDVQMAGWDEIDPFNSSTGGGVR